MTTKPEKEELPFEKALENLEKIVTSMETNQLSLDDMMKHFEKGKKLSDYCSKKLSEFEKKIEILVKENKEGGKWKDFPDDKNNDFELRS